MKPTNAHGPPQIHGFSDASENAFGAVIWLRWNTDSGVELTFVTAKSSIRVQEIQDSLPNNVG